ncbi:hypothetical protein JRQ81_006983, partial [Phrynocephalus forsythii]
PGVSEKKKSRWKRKRIGRPAEGKRRVAHPGQWRERGAWRVASGRQDFVKPLTSRETTGLLDTQFSHGSREAHCLGVLQTKNKAFIPESEHQKDKENLDQIGPVKKPVSSRPSSQFLSA